MVIKHGKITSELELKTLILFMLRGFGGDAPSELIDGLAPDYVESWFDYVVARSELDERGLIAHGENDMWSLTQLGSDTLVQVESSLPPATRRHLSEDIERMSARFRRERYIFTSSEQDGGGVRVKLLLDGDEGTLLDLGLLLPNAELAGIAMERFRQSAEKVYNSIADMLAGN